MSIIYLFAIVFCLGGLITLARAWYTNGRIFRQFRRTRDYSLESAPDGLTTAVGVIQSSASPVVSKNGHDSILIRRHFFGVRDPDSVLTPTRLSSLRQYETLPAVLVVGAQSYPVDLSNVLFPKPLPSSVSRYEKKDALNRFPSLQSCALTGYSHVEVHEEYLPNTQQVIVSGMYLAPRSSASDEPTYRDGQQFGFVSQPQTPVYIYQSPWRWGLWAALEVGSLVGITLWGLLISAYCYGLYLDAQMQNYYPLLCDQRSSLRIRP